MDWEYKCLFVILVVAVIFMFGAVWLFAKPAFWSSWELGEMAGNIGDAIGGMTAPIIGLVTVALIYMTFHDQQRFIKEQADKTYFESMMEFFDKNVEFLEKQNFQGIPLSNLSEYYHKITAPDKEDKPIDPDDFIWRLRMTSKYLFLRLHFLCDLMTAMKTDNKQYSQMIKKIGLTYYHGSVESQIKDLNSEFARISNDHDKKYIQVWDGLPDNKKQCMRQLKTEMKRFMQLYGVKGLPEFEYLS